MNVHLSYRLPKLPAVEKDVQHQIDKLRKRLQVFRPELVHLRGVVEEASAREGTSVSLNLRLPSGQMAVETKAANANAAVKAAFEDLLQQLNRHKEMLRASHRWRRRRGDTTRRGAPLREVPFEQTLAAVFPPTISADDIRSYVNANLSRLERFVEREIYFREAQETTPPNSISKEEVIDQAIVSALGDGDQDKPEKLALEPWLYRQALRALDELSAIDETNGSAVHLEDSARRPNVKGSDEPELQFHQPDESITGATVIADSRISTPEQIMASDELLRMIAAALHDLGPGPREVFILHAIEGFTVDEVTAITGLPQEQVLAFVSAARDHLRKAPGLAEEFHSRSASTGAA